MGFSKKAASGKTAAAEPRQKAVKPIKVDKATAKADKAAAKANKASAKNTKSKNKISGRSFVAIEIEEATIRCVEVSGGSKRTFSKFYEHEIDRGIVSDGDVVDVDALTEILQTIWKEQKYSSREVHIVINSDKAEISYQTMDDEKDFAKAFVHRVPEGAFNVQDYYLGFHNLALYEQDIKDTSTVEGYRTVAKRDVLLVGLRRSDVDHVLDAFKKAKLYPLSLDVAPLAMLRAAPTMSLDNAIDVHINVNSEAMIIVISHKNQPQFVRNLSHHGGSAIRRRIMEEMGADDQYARELAAKSVEMNPSDLLRARKDSEPSVFGIDEAPRYSEDQIKAYQVVQSEIADMIESVNVTVTFFTDRNSSGLGDRFGKFVLSGDTPVLESLRQRIQHETSLAVELATPLDYQRSIGASFSDESVNTIKQEAFTVTLGAAVATGKAQD